MKRSFTRARFISEQFGYVKKYGTCPFLEEGKEVMQSGKKLTPNANMTCKISCDTKFTLAKLKT